MGRRAKKILKKVAKPVGNLVKSAVKDAKTVTKKAVKAAGSLAGNAVRGIGKTVGSGDLKRLGKNIRGESHSAMDKYGDLLFDIGANALTSGAYGAVSNLGNMASTGKIDKKSIIGSLASVAGINPTIANIANAAVQGDAKGAALGLLGSYGNNLGMNSNLTNLITSGLKDDKGGIASALAGSAGLEGDVGKILSGLASKNKGDIASGLGGYFNLDKSTQRLLSGIATDDKKSIGLGLLGSLGGNEFMGQDRFDALDRLVSGGGKFKDKISDAKTLTGGLLPDMEFGFGGGSSGGSKDDSPGFLSNFKGMLDFGTPDFLKNLNVSGMLPSISNPLRGAFDNPELRDKIKNAFPNIDLTPDQLDNAVSQFGQTVKDAFPNVDLTPDQLDSAINQFGRNVRDAFPNVDLTPDGMFSSNNRERIQEEEEEEFMRSEGERPASQGASQGGFLNNVQNWLADNSTGLGSIANIGAGAIGAFDMDKAYQRYQDLQQQQLDQLSREGAELGGMKYDPNRYKRELDFRNERIAGGGYTAKQRKMQQEGDLRAARAGASAREAALELMRRTGSAATGSGAALAAALGGDQSVMNIQSSTNLEREASAEDTLEQDYMRTGGLSTQQTMEEANLAQMKQNARMEQLAKMGDVRQLLGESQIKQAGARRGAARGTSEMVNAYLGGLKTNAEQAEAERIKADAEKKRQAEEDYNARLREEQLRRVRLENENLAAGDKNKPSVTTPPVQTRPSIATPPIVSPSVTPTPAPAPKPSTGSYTIKPGDSLSKISSNLGYSSWQDLYDANKDLIGDDPNKIKAGASLRTFNEAYKR